MKRAKRSIASISTEVAIGTALAVVGLFVVIGLFNDNVANMATHFSLKNIFNADSAGKTTYSSYDRDYTSSEVNVQITGEQGLEMLRKKANNKALDLIENPFATSNSSGGEIAYLSKAVEIISGEGAICVYMKNNSNKHCSDKSIGGYGYDIQIGDADIVISKVDASGNTVEKQVTMTLNGAVSAIVGSYSVPLNNDNYSKYTTDEQYSKIKDLTGKVKNLIDNSVLLVGTGSTYSKTTVVNKSIVQALTSMLNDLDSSLQSAYNTCNLNGLPREEEVCCQGSDWNVDPNHGSVTAKYNRCWVNEDAYNSFHAWAQKEIQQMNDPSAVVSSLFINNKSLNNSYAAWADSAVPTAESIVTSILNSDVPVNNSSLELTTILASDHANSTTACDKLKTDLQNITANYNLGNVSAPECNPVDWTETSDWPTSGASATVDRILRDAAGGITSAVNAVTDVAKSAWKSITSIF